MNPFSVEPTRARRPRGPLVGAALALGAIALALVVVLVASQGRSTPPEDSVGAPTTTDPDRVPRTGPSGPSASTTAKLGDGAEISSCQPVRQPFPVGERTCTIVSPPDLRSGERVPAILLLHGWNTTPSQVLAAGAWSDAVVRHRIVVAAPQGIFSGWNAGGCCGLTQSAQIDDVGFLEQVVAQLKERPDVDPSRVYAVGESNGGMMVYRLLCTAAGELAGAASVEGTPVAGCEPERPIPLLHVHGTADAAVPFGGGQSLVSWVLGVTFPSVGSALERIADAAGCGSGGQTTGDGAVRVTDWRGCDGGVPIRLVALDGVGHEWPRGRYDATEEILEFFGIAS